MNEIKESPQQINVLDFVSKDCSGNGLITAVAGLEKHLHYSVRFPGNLVRGICDFLIPQLHMNWEKKLRNSRPQGTDISRDLP